ncbi:MAG: chloride channel protein [Anaerolineae bacterium]|nr:chloride channel protein [Anaerolineae bacterium]
MATSVGVWLFREGIDVFERYFRSALLEGVAAIAPALVPLGVVLVLALAGLIVGFLHRRLIGDEPFHGVAGVMHTVGYSGGRLQYHRMPAKAALASFSLGAGASVGPEDPSVQIGTNIGSAFGQWLRLSEDKVKLLVGAGAAGGIAAVFGAPIAGVFFALEVILADFSTSTFGVVVLTSVIASAVMQAIEAGGIVFTHANMPELGIANYALGGLGELPLYMLLGVLIAPLSALFIRTLYWQHDVWHHIKLSPPLKTALAGAVVAVMAVFFPQIMGTGRDTLNSLLNASAPEYTPWALLALVVVKIAATTVSLGGGFVGGMFAPSLFVGAAAGRAFGQLLAALFPGMLTANPAAFAIAGMAAAMGGVIRSPITAVLLLFELTNDYRLILPIMLTTAVSLIVVERLAPDGLYHFGLARKGIRLIQGRHIDLMQMISVGEVMTTSPQTVRARLPLTELAQEFAKENHHGLLVVDDDGQLYGIVTLRDLARANEAGELAGRTTGEIGTRDVLTVTPNTSIADALKVLGARDLGRLPVVDPNDGRRVVGLLRRADIVRAYDAAAQRRQEMERYAARVRLENLAAAQIIELHVEPRSWVDKRRISDVGWPAGCVVATVHRQGAVIIPRGDTPLYAGDVLTVVSTEADLPELATLVATHPSPAEATAGASQSPG